ncbi:hypothetical protein Tco_0801881 [Tanacetum coccineum]|uniref:Uncharacterized protein n=1 Tax=Tanacetum coccineum TaxID=301880 RepID=A0ABQ5A1I2_9ASTR
MKVVFVRACSEDEPFAGLMRDLCFSLRISLSKKRRLVAELEALGERGDAARSLEHMREIVAHDSVTLGDLEQLLAHAQVEVSLKDGYGADMEEKESLGVSICFPIPIEVACKDLGPNNKLAKIGDDESSAVA